MVSGGLISSLRLLAASGGTYRESCTEFTVRGLSGTRLAEWFGAQAGTGRFQDKSLLVNAHPEHYVEPPAYTGGMVETIGGHLTRFKVSVARELPAAVSAYLDASYPVTLMNARLGPGRRHPLRVRPAPGTGHRHGCRRGRTRHQSMARCSLISGLTKRCTKPHRRQISPVALSSAQARLNNSPPVLLSFTPRSRNRSFLQT